jgi:glycerol uptake facilitator-like aquaporin
MGITRNFVLMKTVRIISIFIGMAMLMFGFLKLFYPISEWFAIQISKSGLPGYLYWPGILSEISVGLILLLGVFFSKKHTAACAKNSFAVRVRMGYRQHGLCRLCPFATRCSRLRAAVKN